MPIDFTVIQPVRQRFGDTGSGEPQFEIQSEQEAPFVGKSKDFPFSCPNVDPKQMAVLKFESLGVSAGRRAGLPRDILQINGINIPGGITSGPALRLDGQDIPLWKSHSLIVDANVLKENNVLHIESVFLSTSFPLHELDNFIIDNIVVFFKTRVRVSQNL